MTRSLTCVVAALLAFRALSASAQQKATAQNVPEIPYTSVPNLLKVPAGETLGEAVGIATNSKGHIFVFCRSNNTRLWEVDKIGKFVKEVGKGYHGYELAHSVRIDTQDNISTAGS